MTVERIRDLLQSMNLRAVAKDTGLHYNTIRAIAKGKDNIMYPIAKKLSDYFQGRE